MNKMLPVEFPLYVPACACGYLQIAAPRYFINGIIEYEHKKYNKHFLDPWLMLLRIAGGQQ